MKQYLRWSISQLFSLYYRPVRFEPDAADQQRPTPATRIVFLVKILPWIVAISAIGNLLAGFACVSLGTQYDWEDSWQGLAAGALINVAFGLIAEPEVILGFGILWGFLPALAAGLG